VVIAQVIVRARSLVRSLEEVFVRSLWLRRSGVAFAAYPMLLTTVFDKPPSMLPDEGPKLLFIACELVAAESPQFEARFGGFLFFSDRLRTSASKVGRALYLFGNI
jgi:hypothetical protein